MYMVMSRDQHAGQNHNIKIGSKSFARVEQLKYLGVTLKGKEKKVEYTLEQAKKVQSGSRGIAALFLQPRR